MAAENCRAEWEFPGGKLDPGEQPEDTVAREILEELGVRVEVGDVVANYLHIISESVDEADGVLVSSYACRFIDRVAGLEHEAETGRAEFARFSVAEIGRLNLPHFYRVAIEKAARWSRRTGRMAGAERAMRASRR